MLALIEDRIEPSLDISALAGVLFPYGVRSRLLLMISVYLDESGTHDRSLNVSIGGWISSEYRWGKFQRQWQKVLDKFEAKNLHMKEFENPYSVYKKEWSEEKRVQFLTELTRVIHANTMIPIASSASVPDYDVALKRFPGVSPYGFCLLECLKSVAHWAQSKNHSEPVACVLEAGAGFGNDVEEIKKRILKRRELKDFYRIASITFADKDDFSQLQASDFLAYECHKEINNWVSEETKRPFRKSYGALIRKRDATYIRFYNQESYLSQSKQLIPRD
jgi:hypothetical protein